MSSAAKWTLQCLVPHMYINHLFVAFVLFYLFIYLSECCYFKIHVSVVTKFLHRMSIYLTQSSFTWTWTGSKNWRSWNKIIHEQSSTRCLFLFQFSIFLLLFSKLPNEPFYLLPDNPSRLPPTPPFLLHSSFYSTTVSLRFSNELQVAKWPSTPTFFFFFCFWVKFVLSYWKK